MARPEMQNSDLGKAIQASLQSGGESRLPLGAQGHPCVEAGTAPDRRSLPLTDLPNPAWPSPRQNAGQALVTAMTGIGGEEGFIFGDTAKGVLVSACVTVCPPLALPVTAWGLQC